MKKQKVVDFLKHNKTGMMLSFALPILIMFITYYTLGIYPGSERSILASDSFSQYAAFHASFKNAMQGKQSFFYSWSSSMGLNFWALSAYYLNGLFTPLVILFDNSAMPDAIYFLTLLKFGASGLSFWVFSHNTYKINRWITVGLSVAYALSAYAIAYGVVVMWLDAFVYLPLIVLGIHRLMDKKKPVLLFVSYLLLFVSNFYMAFMIGLFTFLYVVARTFTDWKLYKKTFLSYLCTSFLAGGASMITILPTILDLKNNGEGLTTIRSFITPDVGAWDLIAKNLVGVYDTSKYESMPFIYIGLIPLIFCLFYFVSRKISLKNKLLYGSLFIILIASIYIYPLNLFWHGMHAPNMFLFRFSFLISFLVILLAGYGIELFEKEDANTLTNIFLATGGVFLLFLLLSNKKRYGVITTQSLVVTIALLVIYLLIWMGYVYRPNLKKWMPILLLIFMSGEALVNSKSILNEFKEDWAYPTKANFSENHDAINSLVEEANQRNENFFRLENLNGSSVNDSFIYGYHGVSMFSSIRNRHSSQYLNALGFRSLGTNLTIQYSNNTLLADTLVGMKYNISTSNLAKFGYKRVAKQDDFMLYENQYAMPLGVFTDDLIYEEDAVKTQTELFNHLADVETEYFDFGEVTLLESENAVVNESVQDGKVIEIGEKEPGQSKVLKWLVTVPAKKQGYFSIVPTDFGEQATSFIKFSVKGREITTRAAEAGQYYNLGYYEEPTSVEITTTIYEGPSTTSIFRPDAVFLDTEKFAESAEKIQSKGVDFKVDGRRAKANISSEKDQVVLTTIPYERGWKVYIDGKKAEIETFKDAFLTVKVPKGNHEIEFVYLPQGFLIGAISCITCIILFALYIWWLSRKSKKELDVTKVEKESGELIE